MVAQRTIAEIKAEDQRWKPNGHQFDLDAHKLGALADHRGRKITYEHLRAVKMGDPENPNPMVVGVIPRLTESLSVLYRVPATRRLKRGLDVLPDDDPQVQTFTEVSERTMLDNVWQIVDAKRNLLRQCVVSWVESSEHESVQARVFEPYNVFRMPSAGAADVIEADRAVALQIRDGVKETDRIYQLWQHDDDGWRCWIVDEANAYFGEQPYGLEGLVPFDEVPLLMVYDDLPVGAAYLPIPESRLDFAMNVTALLNDIAYLVKLEAHSMKVLKTPDAKAAPTSVGPDKIAVIPPNAQMDVLSHSPKIADAVLTVERALAMLAMAESLPPDYFSASRVFHTGPALKTAERDLEARRQRQRPLAVSDERRAFRKIRSIHNHFCPEWGLDPLDDDLTLAASFGRSWQPVDASELQKVWGFDLAVGSGSMIDYIQERFNCDRAQAISMFKQVQADRGAYPVKNQQNPAALVPGENPALGPGGATKVPGAFNPDMPSSTEGASSTDAAARAVRAGPDLAVIEGGAQAAETAAPAELAVVAGGGSKAQDTALNGAQIDAAKQIVGDVAKGLLPRESGIEMLVEFFNLDRERAERIMGPVGRSFKVAAPEPSTPPKTPDAANG